MLYFKFILQIFKCSNENVSLILEKTIPQPNSLNKPSKLYMLYFGFRSERRNFIKVKENYLQNGNVKNRKNW